MRDEQRRILVTAAESRYGEIAPVGEDPELLDALVRGGLLERLADRRTYSITARGRDLVACLD